MQNADFSEKGQPSLNSCIYQFTSTRLESGLKAWAAEVSSYRHAAYFCLNQGCCCALVALLKWR